MNPFLLVVPVSLLMIAVELFVAHRRGVQVYRLKDSITSLNIGATSQFVITLGAFISVSMYTLILEKFGAFVWDTANPLTWVLALVLYDFFYYWVHRTGHEVNFFWASHVIHHSSEEFNLSTAMRQSATGFYFKWVFYIPLALLGFPLKVFLAVGFIDLVYQIWVHTRLVGRLGFLEWFLVTPSNHRVHHGQNDYCLDKNYGGIFSVWDRMFGTYADERASEPVVYGVRKPLHSWNPIWGNVNHYVLIWQAVRSTPGWRNKLMCVFAGPSWQPAGATPLPEFVPAQFERFDTPAPAWMLWLGLITCALGMLVLSYYLAVQKNLGTGPSLAIAAGALLFYFVVGLLWQSPRIQKAAHV